MAKETKAAPEIEERPLPPLARRALGEMLARQRREYLEAMGEITEAMDLAPGDRWQLDAERMVLVRIAEE